ncbi:MAG TPA: ferritin-like fold-containing protein [Phycicoccus sp.]|nr:ferritin-like fold-containing protein [Phycicoccus sp.]
MTQPIVPPAADPAGRHEIGAAAPAARPGEPAAYANATGMPPADSAAVTDLLGVLAHGALMGALRMAADADLAPTLRLKASMATLAFGEFRHYEDLARELQGRGLDPDTAMQPFVAPFSAYHERTRPSDWLEALVKAYVGEGIARDFFREMADFVDAAMGATIAAVLADRDQAEFVVPLVQAATATDPRVTGRLSLWGRRLLGEALSQAQAVAADRDALANLLVSGEADLNRVGEMFARLRDRHQDRMRRLGLTP